MKHQHFHGRMDWERGWVVLLSSQQMVWETRVPANLHDLHATPKLRHGEVTS